jgi:hypothetical protein
LSAAINPTEVNIKSKARIAVVFFIEDAFEFFTIDDVCFLKIFNVLTVNLLDVFCFLLLGLENAFSALIILARASAITFSLFETL